MKNEQEIVRSVFDAYIRDAKANSTKKDRPTFDMLEEVKNMAINALEQPTSNDCVSRAEVRKIAKEMYLEVANMDLDVHTISDCISYTSSKCRQVLEKKLQALPPATPTRKVGKWIYNRDIQNWECSECSETPKTLGCVGTAAFMTEHFKFCNHCGAEMKGESDNE